MREITLDLGDGSASLRTLCALAGDFPSVPRSLLGRRCRYAYMAVFDAESEMATFSGIAKVDLLAADPANALAGLIDYGPSTRGGEPVFVPRPGGGRGGLEDEGWLLSYVHDEAAGRSELLVYDARTMSAAPVARVALRRRVPYGFHCNWVSCEELGDIEQRQKQQEL